MNTTTTTATAVHPNAALVRRFYAAFAAHDWAGMAACYHPEVHFTDEVFDLRGADASLMWRMLCTSGRELYVKASGIEADDARGRAHWDARYKFSATGRRVHNQIDAEFEFRDGLIVRHVDRFDFKRWARQALGLRGWLFGWTPWLRRKVRAGAALSLAAFIDRRAGRKTEAAASA